MERPPESVPEETASAHPSPTPATAAPMQDARRTRRRIDGGGALVLALPGLAPHLFREP
ncbi:MAG TPA: hypothetical protein VEZ40_18925 [Pyrinomonadaceae bacterium]|nr:hypothetical protein [Pyrinomonadaceae bacterium]